MKILYILLFVFGIATTQAKDVVQITADQPHFLISVTNGGVVLGDIEIEMYPQVAPKHCHNFDSLVSIKFYDGCAFHRVIPTFMIQGGDPNSKDKDKSTWGYGDPSQTKVPAEFNDTSHHRGILSAARLGNDINSATSQFFICIANQPQLDHQYSIYGHVVTGMNIADSIVKQPRDAKDNPLQKIEMTIKKLSTSVNISKGNDNPENIIISPNPSSDILAFHSDNINISIMQISIIDYNGNNYFTENYQNAKNISDIRIALSNIPVGVYFVKLLNKIGNVYILKMVVN